MPRFMGHGGTCLDGLFGFICEGRQLAQGDIMYHSVPTSADNLECPVRVPFRYWHAHARERGFARESRSECKGCQGLGEFTPDDAGRKFEFRRRDILIEYHFITDLSIPMAKLYVLVLKQIFK
jgi:hypothetical protein